ncbi:MAG: hypothetical protein SGBAC_001257 [Bacillariaceae sp.]
MKLKYTSLAVAVASVAQSVTAFAPTRQTASNMALAAFFPAPPTPPAIMISVSVPSTTMTISESSASKEALMLFTKELSLEKEEKALEKEVKEVEKESRKDAKAARVEKSREAFYEYEAKKAAEEEARIEAAERKATADAKKDEEEVLKLKAAEQKAEKEAAEANTKREKVEKQAEAKRLMAKEKAMERKEQAAERAERRFLAEEEQETKNRDAKAAAARREEEKFEAIEKKAEEVAATAKAEEALLKYEKDTLAQAKKELAAAKRAEARKSTITTEYKTAGLPTSLNVATSPPVPTTDSEEYFAEISEEHPLKVLVAGAGVGGLALARVLSKNPNVDVTVLERTDEFKRFGGPIQLASNALEVVKEMDREVFDQIMEKFTYTGDKENGIKDGIRTEWYAKFDLATPAENRNMPYTGVIERPDLQNIYLENLPKGIVQNGDGVKSYTTDSKTGAVTVELDSGKTVNGDVLIGADGIWSAVRATMRAEPARGEGSGASYSGYTVFAGELDYPSPDNGQVGYKVYIGPGQYFVITDIGNGRYQWYAFLARAPGSVNDPKPEGSSKYLQNTFAGWSPEIFAILTVTKEDEIEQRDLYDRPPSVRKPWTKGHVALLGDGIHAMMPNLGQGGCQAIEDAYVISSELGKAKSRTEVTELLKTYQRRRLVRSAAVQGLSRFASDIIIRGFDTPAKIVKKDDEFFPRFENFNYAGIVTRMLQPILPIFFSVQFNFLYDGFRNEFAIDIGAALGFLVIGGFILLASAGVVGEAGIAASIGLDALLGAEGFLDFEAISSTFEKIFSP